MEEPRLPDDWEPIPVPESMHSVYLEGPFTQCVSCGADLMEEANPYQIQKVWRTGEVVFELALCLGCAEQTMREFSRESIERMQAFFRERYRPVEGNDHCHFCGAAREPESEFAMLASCHAGLLLRPMTVICGKCNADSQEGLSRKTRDAMEDFIGKNLPGVPFELEPDKVPFGF
jgi:hypothetical protein